MTAVSVIGSTLPDSAVAVILLKQRNALSSVSMILGFTAVTSAEKPVSQAIPRRTVQEINTCRVAIRQNYRKALRPTAVPGLVGDSENVSYQQVDSGPLA